MADEREGRILSTGEIEALLSALKGEESGSTESSAAVPYDFRRPAQLTRDRLRSIGAAFERFSRTLESSLSMLLRTSVQARVSGIEPLSYGDAVRTWPRPACVCSATANVPGATLVVEIGPRIVFPIFERLVGGAGLAATTPPERALSELEWQVIKNKLIAILLRDIREMLGAGRVEVSLLECSSEPETLKALPEHEPVVALQIEVVFGDNHDRLTFCLTQTLLDLLSTSPTSRAPLQTGGTFPTALSTAEVTLGAFLRDQIIQLGDLSRLRPGDVLVTRHGTREPVVVCVGECPKFEGQVGAAGKEHRGIKIMRPVTSGEVTTTPTPEPVQVRAGGAKGESLASALVAMPVTCAVVVARREIDFQSVLDLKPGTVIPLPKHVDEPLEFVAGARVVARGRAMRVSERLGLQLL